VISELFKEYPLIYQAEYYPLLYYLIFHLHFVWKKALSHLSEINNDFIEVAI